MAISEEKTNVEFYFREKGKVQPKGFDACDVDATVTVVIKGTVTSVSHSRNKWEPGKHFTMTIKSCEIIGPEKKVSLDDALEEAKKKI